MVPILCLSMHGQFVKVRTHLEGNLVQKVINKRENFDGKAFHICWPSNLIDNIVKTEVYKMISDHEDPLQVVLHNLNQIHTEQRTFGKTLLNS